MVRYCFSERWCEAEYTTTIWSTEGKHSGGFEVSSLVQGFWRSLSGHHTISGFRPLKLPAHLTRWKSIFLFISRKRAITATLPQRAEGLPSPGDIHRVRPPLFRTISHNNVNSPTNPSYAPPEARSGVISTQLWTDWPIIHDLLQRLQAAQRVQKRLDFIDFAKKIYFSVLEGGR